MRIILMVVLVFASSAFAETIPFDSLNGIKRLEFREPGTECYESKKGERCHTYQECVREEFHAIGKSEIYYALTNSVAINYLHEDEEPISQGKSCYGEPGAQHATVFRKTASGYQRLGKITSGQCSLYPESIQRLSGRELLAAKCSFSGTGNMVEWSFYLVEDSTLRKASVDESFLQELDIPAGQSLGNERYEWRDHGLRRYTFSHPRHCQCVAGYIVDLKLVFNNEWEPVLTFVEGSYQPGFTSLSNARNKRGLKYYREGNYAAAVREFEQAQKLDVANYEAISNLGLAHLRSGNLDQSIRYSLQVFSFGNDKLKSNAAYNLGKAYEGQGNLEQSLKYYRAANDISPSAARKKSVDRILASMGDDW